MAKSVQAHVRRHRGLRQLHPRGRGRNRALRPALDHLVHRRSGKAIADVREHSLKARSDLRKCSIIHYFLRT